MDAPPVETTAALTVAKAPTTLLWDPPVAVEVGEALRNGPQGQLNASLLPTSYSLGLSLGIHDRALEIEGDNIRRYGEVEEEGNEDGLGPGPGLGGLRGGRGLSDAFITYHSDPLQGAQSCHPGWNTPCYYHPPFTLLLPPPLHLTIPNKPPPTNTPYFHTTTPSSHTNTPLFSYHPPSYHPPSYSFFFRDHFCRTWEVHPYGLF